MLEAGFLKYETQFTSELTQKLNLSLNQ